MTVKEADTQTHRVLHMTVDSTVSVGVEKGGGTQ